MKNPRRRRRGTAVVVAVVERAISSCDLASSAPPINVSSRKAKTGAPRETPRRSSGASQQPLQRVNEAAGVAETSSLPAAAPGSRGVELGDVLL